VRCGNIYGGGDLNWNRLIPGTIKQLLQGKNPEIRSDGTSTRDFLFVEDVVQAYLKIAYFLSREDVQGESFNLGMNHPYSVLEVVEMLQKLMGREDLAPRILNSAKAEISHQTLSAKKAEKFLLWRPTHTFEEGLAKTIHWYENYFSLAKR
jgi:CDP-glucose 4,6-dehydratase